MNREYRKTLVEKYLNAEFSLEEERMLAEWFSVHKAESDEESVAKLILAEYPEAAYDAAEKEFDAIISSKQTRRTTILRWAYSFAACAVIALGLGIFLNQHDDTCDFNGIEIAQGINQIMSLDVENIESVIAKPQGNNVILTATMHDGTHCSYLMTKDGTDALSITAMK